MTLEMREAAVGELIELTFRQLPTSTPMHCEWFRDPQHDRADWLLSQRSIFGRTLDHVSYVCHEHAAEIFEHYAGLIS